MAQDSSLLFSTGQYSKVQLSTVEYSLVQFSRVQYSSVVFSSNQFSTVMSTNIKIFKYSNKMGLEYYSYWYFCHFPNKNIFAYLFVDFWTTNNIRIFVLEFFKIRIYSNICLEPYSKICLSMGLIYASNKYQLQKLIFKKHHD